MKNILILLILFTGCCSVYGQQSSNSSKIVYDSALAAKLGADQYGMKTFYLVFLKRGERQVKDSAERANIQAGHLKNIIRLARENKMIIAGPFLDDQAIRGIFIFNAGSREEVENMLKTDPAVKAGVLATEVHPWYGPASLLEIGALQEAIQKNSIVDD